MIGCGCSSRTIRTATTRAGSWCRATCSATWSGRRSSSPTTTRSCGARRCRCRRAAAPCCRGARARAADEGDRRADAAARHAGPDGHEADPGPERRGAPLLPREAGRGGRRRPAEGRRPQGGRAEPRGGAGLDFGARSRPAEARPAARDRPVGDALLPARLRLRGGDAVPVDGERLLADGRHRVRHREAAARAGGRQHPRRRDAEVPEPVAHPPEDAEAGPRQGGRARPRRSSTTSSPASSARTSTASRRWSTDA